MKDTHLLITVLVVGKAILIATITLLIKAKRSIKEIRDGLELLGVVKKKGPPETKVLQPDPLSVTETKSDAVAVKNEAVLQYPPGDANTPWDHALLQEIENISRLTCCSAQHNGEMPLDLHEGTDCAIAVSTVSFRRMVLWGLAKAREQGNRDGQRQLADGMLGKQAAPPAGEKPSSGGA